MWNWWPLRTHRSIGMNPHRTTLRLEALESREVPAVLIQIDYSLDTGFFANNPTARAVMERVASEIGNSISADLPAISPSGGNTWTASFINPATGGQVAVPNMTIGAGAIKVFVAGRAMGGTEAGFAATSGFSASGAPAWVDSVSARDWGGSIAFDTARNWFFGETTAGLASGQLDFYSVATHEMGHVLGIGTSSQWTSLAQGGYFRGASAMSVYGGPVPLAPDGIHWAEGVMVGGHVVSLDPSVVYGQRVGWSALDAAALHDLGWGAASTTSLQPIAVTSGGSVSLVASVGGTMAPTGGWFVPFPGYTGELRLAAGDFNGDGATDYAVTPGAGAQAVVEIVNGRDGSLLVGPTDLFPGYTGGLYLAAGDIDGDGKAELVVAAGQSAPPLVATYQVSGGGLQRQAAFFAFDAAWFGGGIRVAVGDLNRDGFDDVVVTTASMVGAVATYSGADLRFGVANYLFSPFIPLFGSSLGLNAAVGDMDGDGYADLVLTFESGGPAIVAVWSGAALSQNPNTPANQIPASTVFLALSPSDIDGARLAMRDLDSDGKADLVVASGSRLNPVIRAFTFAQGLSGGAFANPLGANTSSGVYVA